MLYVFFCSLLSMHFCLFLRKLKYFQKDSIVGADKHYISCVSVDSRSRVFRLVGIVLKASDPQRVSNYSSMFIMIIFIFPS